MDPKLAQKVETRVSAQVRLFLGELRAVAPEKAREAAKNWEDYKPELLKCESKEEVARLLVSFFERSLRAVRDIDAEDFHRLRYNTVGKMMKCMWALNVHKNTIKDYIKHLHSIEGKPLGRGIRMADEGFERPREVVKPKKPITVDELKRRLGKREFRRELDSEILAAGAFAVAALTLFLVKLFG